jgi:uncharacterized protein
MTHPNEDVIRRGYEAFNTGDMDTLRELFDPDIVWHVPGRNAISGDHRGPDAVLGFFGKVFEITGGTFRADLHDVTANDEHAAALHVARGQSQGKTLEDNNVVAFHVHDGKIVEAWHYFEDQYANDEFWV